MKLVRVSAGYYELADGKWLKKTRITIKGNWIEFELAESSS